MSKPNHEEWEQENSLTCPSDKSEKEKWTPNQFEAELNEKETSEALKTQFVDTFTKKFKRVERKYADPPISLQTFGLISFVPAKGATPNEKGIYGFCKLRGNFATLSETTAHAENLIRKVDSYHKIYTTYVGRPFPLTLSSEYSQETSDVDMQKDTTETISHDIKKKREKEEQEMNEIKEREKQLLDEAKKDPNDPALMHDNYTTLRVKKAQLSWTFLETERKLNEMKELIIKTKREIEEMDQAQPEYKSTYFEKYMDARRKSGLSTDQHQNNFMKYLVEDAVLPF